jgi:hypothetical protein
MVQFDQCRPHAPREDCVTRSVTPTNCAITEGFLCSPSMIQYPRTCVTQDGNRLIQLQ